MEHAAEHAAEPAVEPKLAAAPLGPGQGGEVAVNMAVARRFGDPREAGGLPSVHTPSVQECADRRYWSTPDEAESEAGPEAEPTAEAAADHRVLAADPDWTKLVDGRFVSHDFMPRDRTEAEIVVVAMRELLCGENGELQNLTEDGHIRLYVLAIVLYLIEDVRGLSQGLMLDVDAFVHIMEENAWKTPEAARWLEDHRTGKPDTQADIRGWWFITLPFDKAIHGQLLAAIGTKAKKRKHKKKKSGSKRK